MASAEPLFAIACHCLECQRRSGAPFGAGVYFPGDAVAIAGAVAHYARDTDSGGTMRNRFCPICGTTIAWTIDAYPELIGIAIGTIDALPPTLAVDSLWERSMQRWVSIDAAATHHPMGYPAPA